MATIQISELCVQITDEHDIELKDASSSWDFQNGGLTDSETVLVVDEDMYHQPRHHEEGEDWVVRMWLEP